MSDRNLYMAARQYATRPPDERFDTLPALLAAARADADASVQALTTIDHLHARPSDDGAEVILNGRQNAAKLSNWSFGQLAAIGGAPGQYLRTLPAQLAADCLNYGIGARVSAAKLAADQARKTYKADPIQLLIRQSPDAAAGVLPTVRAVTSEQYNRVFDADLVDPLIRLQEHDPRWQLPMTWEGTRAGAYRGDRDLFVILTDGGSIVEDPTLRDGTPGAGGAAPGGNARAMYRGVIVRNSEVGACSLQLHTILFRYICGNHIIWGVERHAQYRRRHVGAQTAPEFFAQLRDTLRNLANRPASVDVEHVKALAAREPWQTKEHTVHALRAIGATEKQADAAYTAAEQYEANPRSVWGLMNGITRVSQSSEYSADRLALDLLALQLQKSYARVAA